MKLVHVGGEELCLEHCPPVAVPEVDELDDDFVQEKCIQP